MHVAVAARCDIDIEPPAELLVECLRAIDVGNGEHHDFEFHVWTVYLIATHLVLLLVGKFAVQIRYFSFFCDRPIHTTQVI
ncbi:hypothetical protein [Oculatella sp. FACHB-28]|uniref:hypothetical protein n=1 Tax=Oculatella sp. FACHB-28 TaxID=2692845 RepID=UPI001F554167|nr:hypothetical protein [Oculatella sp. FACHB-28]